MNLNENGIVTNEQKKNLLKCKWWGFDVICMYVCMYVMLVLQILAIIASGSIYDSIYQKYATSIGKFYCVYIYILLRYIYMI